MQFNNHSELAGRHAFLSASKYHWIRYEDEKLDETFRNALSKRKGTEFHELAYNLIRLGVKLPANQKTLSRYVNDAIGFRMEPEVMLWYSDNAFGTADALSFRRNLLRIHDLKTGICKSSMDQLKIYAAFFCLEYRFKPMDIEMELRIYQNDEVEMLEPDPDEITHIMDRTISLDKRIEMLKLEVAL